MGVGAPPKIRRRPREPDVLLPEGPPLLRNLEAHAPTVQGPCRPGLDGLPLPRSARGRAEGQAQRNVQARPLHARGRERAAPPSNASSTVAQGVASFHTARTNQWTPG